MQVGDFLSSLLVTDTLVYEVVGVTPKTIKIRRAKDGEVVRSENIDGNIYAVTYTGQVPNPAAAVRTVRLRKDGTYRIHYWSALLPCHTIDGVPVRRTDYRY
jgi:TRAP-type uncharacterized transport system substrate-binding protein